MGGNDTGRIMFLGQTAENISQSLAISKEIEGEDSILEEDKLIRLKF